MTWSDIILDLVLRLKNKIEAGQISEDPLSSIPISEIQSLLHRTMLNFAEIRLHAVEATGQMMRVVKGWSGTRQDPKDIKTIGLFYSSPNIAKSSPIKVGEISFYSKFYITEYQAASLEVFSIELANYIAKKLIYYNQKKCDHISKRIYQNLNLVGDMSSIVPDDDEAYHGKDIHPETVFSYDTESKRKEPGSVVDRTIKELGKALKSFSCYFCTCIEDCIVVEYLSSKHKNNENNDLIFSRLHEFTATEGFKKELNKGQIFIYKKSLFVNDRNNNNAANWWYLVSPITLYGSPIGLIIAQYNKEKTLFIDSVRKILEYVSKSIQNQTRYLLQRRFKKLVINPYFRSRNTKIDEKKVFVLMPFVENWSKRIWEKILKPTITEAGFDPVRADDMFGQNIMEDVWSSILSARAIIADITGRNPNVFYELGIAHTLGKEVIITTQNIDDIPFDLQGYRCINYEDNIDGCDRLKLEVYAHLKNRCEDC